MGIVEKGLKHFFVTSSCTSHFLNKIDFEQYLLKNNFSCKLHQIKILNDSTISVLANELKSLQKINMHCTKIMKQLLSYYLGKLTAFRMTTFSSSKNHGCSIKHMVFFFKSLSSLEVGLFYKTKNACSSD